MEKNWLQKLLIKLRSRFENKFNKELKNQLRPYIIPSKFGFYFGSGILVLLLLAFTYANQLIYLIAFFYSGFLFIVMHLTNNNIKYLKLESFTIPAFFADQQGKIYLTLKNEHQKYNVRFINLKVEGINKDKNVSHIKPNSRVSIIIDFEMPQKGLYPFPHITISSRFPFGIFYTWKKLFWKLNYFVYPSREGDLPLPQLSQNDKNQELMEAVYEIQSGNNNFIMHKELTPSDNYKRIDWKVLARKNKLYIKIFDEETSHFVLVDTTMLFSDSSPTSQNKKIKQLTKWLYETQKNRIPCFVKYQNKSPQLLETPKDYNEIYEYLTLFNSQPGKKNEFH